MNDIDEIKSRLNIVDIVGKSVKLKKTGRNFKGLCPFHNEKTPSFIVSPDRQRFHCFGCGRGGSIFDFIMELHHIEFAEALEDLAALAGVTLARRPEVTQEGKLKEKLYEVNHLASEFYHYILTKHALGGRGLLYLKNRGVSEKSMKTFMLGYSPNSWDGLYRFLRKKGYEEELLEKAGLIIRSTKNYKGKTNNYYDRFRGRVMFALHDHRGNVAGFAGRTLESKSLPAGRQEAKYINTQETPVYVKSNIVYALNITKDAIQKENNAVVMEGELDVISSFQAGIPNAVAIKGSALTEGHVRLIRRFTDRLTFALDSDLAGDAAARRGIEVADSAGLEMRVVTIPAGKDPDEAARESPSLLKKAIADAVPVYDYFLSSAVKRYDATTAYGKKRISDEFLPILSKIENSIVKNHYVRQLSHAIATSEEAISERLDRINRESGLGRPQDAAEPETHITRPEKLELYLLALLLQGNTVELFEELEDSGLLPDFTRPAVHKILDFLIGYLAPKTGGPEGKRVFLMKDFADTLPTELHTTLDEAFMWDISDILSDDEHFLREWHNSLREFKKIILRKNIQALTKRHRGDGAKQSESVSFQKELTGLTDSLRELEKESQI
jgi:DNA primase